MKQFFTSVAPDKYRYDLHLERSFDFSKIREQKAEKDGHGVVYKTDSPCVIDLQEDNIKKMGGTDQLKEQYVAGNKNESCHYIHGHTVLYAFLKCLHGIK